MVYRALADLPIDEVGNDRGSLAPAPPKA
jgi:hypothetical protein